MTLRSILNLAPILITNRESLSGQEDKLFHSDYSSRNFNQNNLLEMTLKWSISTTGITYPGKVILNDSKITPLKISVPKCPSPVQSAKIPQQYYINEPKLTYWYSISWFEPLQISDKSRIHITKTKYWYLELHFSCPLIRFRVQNLTN